MTQTHTLIQSRQTYTIPSFLRWRFKSKFVEIRMTLSYIHYLIPRTLTTLKYILHSVRGISTKFTRALIKTILLNYIRHRYLYIIATIFFIITLHVYQM